MDPATDMGGSSPAYPSTLWATVLDARDRQAAGFRENLDRLIRAYWKPVYWTLRTRWKRSNEEAKDLCQAFFASFLDKDRLAGVAPERGRFRTYLRVVLDNFMRNELEAAGAVKRGGRTQIVSMDGTEEEIPLPTDSLRPEEIFDRAWALHVFQSSVDALRDEYRAAGRDEHFGVFKRRELDRDPPSAASLAAELGLPPHEVENRLKRARTDLARILRGRVQETVTPGDRIEDELQALRDSMG